MKTSRAHPVAGAEPAKGWVVCSIALALVAVLVGCRRTPKPAILTPTSWLTLVARPSTATSTAAQAGQTPQATPLPTKPSQPVLISTLAVSSLPAAGHRPSGVAILGDRVYVSNHDSNNVSVIVSEVVRDIVPVGRGPSAILAAPGSGRVFVLNEGDSTLSVLEGTTVVATWPLPEQPSTLLLVGEQLWVGSRRGGRITILSPKDGSTLGEVDLSANSMVFQMVASGDGRLVYAASYARIHVIDATSRQEIKSTNLAGVGLLAVPSSGQGLYASGYDLDKQEEYLALLDDKTFAEVRRLPSVSDLAALVSDLASGRLYLLSSFSDELVVLDGQSGQPVARLTVGYEPRSMALDTQSGFLYVANYKGDNVAVVDTGKLALVATVPLAVRMASMDADPISGQLYVAAGSANSVFVLGEAGFLDQWPVGGYPSQVRVIPGTGLVACLSLIEDKLMLLDQAGRVVETYATGHRPRGLALDEIQRRIFAGDTVIQWEQHVTHTLAISTPAGSVEQPVQIVLDARRNRYYAVLANGIPGSNYGYMATRLDDGVANPQAPAPGQLSIVELIYDEEMDRFYSTSVRMGTYGLQVSRAEDCQQLCFTTFNRYPAAMALNPATRHLWVVLQAVSVQTAASDTLIVAYDTRTFGQAAQFRVDGLVESLAVDPRSNRVYLANGDKGIIHVVQDVPTAAPSGPLTYNTPTS